MKLNLYSFILFVITFLVPGTPSAARCEQKCGDWKLPYPFGFSASCEIQLNCTSTATILASDFPVQSITGDTIFINIPHACSRPVEDLGRLFTQNYAPTSLNAFLLRNCSAPSATACLIPTTVKANFELLDCGKKNDSINCYYSDNATSFMNYENLRGSGCRSMFSAISFESFRNSSSVLFGAVRIGWWLMGECRCSENANCVRVSPPVDGNKTAYRCQCVEGFAGDGFRDGVGCRKECNTSHYLSAECGGTIRIGVPVGAAAAGASLIISLALLRHFLRERSNLTRRSRKTQQLLKTIEITIPVCPYKELEKATDFFSDKRKLGNGAYGTVYSGKLSNGEMVAVKRLKNRDSNNTEHVLNEIKLLSTVNHPNLVRLLGFSVENEEHILVYEFMSYGTLYHHLQREKGNGLPWIVRLNVACETAQAISYLHNSMNPPIYHRDIKSSNILLDYEYKSKVADFGLCRFGKFESSHVSTTPQGTPGYIDPQYHQNFHLSDKSDVHSFGVVLIEIITALRAMDFGRVKEDINLAALAMDRIRRRCLDEIIDPIIMGQDRDSWTVSSVHKVAELAFRCLDFDRKIRPSMMEVAGELDRIRMSKGESSELKIVGLSEGHSFQLSSSGLSEKLTLDKETGFSTVSVQEPLQSGQS